MDIAISINQQARLCTKMCHRDFDAACHDHAGADRLKQRIAERLPASYAEPELGLRVALDPHPAPFEAMITSKPWRHRIKAGILNNQRRIAELPIARLRALEEAGLQVDSIFGPLIERAHEKDDPEIFEFALSFMDITRLTSRSFAPRWIDLCTPARAKVLADFLRQMGALAPRALEDVLKIYPRVGNQDLLSPKLVLVADFFYEDATAEIEHQGEGNGGLGMAVVRALRSNHGRIEVLGRWSDLEDRLALTRADITAACPGA